MNVGSKRKKGATVVVASITIPDALLNQIRDHVQKEDMTVSQYLRRLAKDDLEKEEKTVTSA